MSAVRVDLRKWPDRPHRRVDGVRLGEDDFGTWVGVREETIAYVFLIPRNSWWIGRHFDDGGWKLDVATVAEWCGDETVTMFDLALDVRRCGGRTWIEDEVEFAADVRAGRIPHEFAGPARAAGTDLDRALRADQEPFGSAGAGWLSEWITSTGP